MSVDRDIALGVECALPPMSGTERARKPRWIAWIVALLAFVCALQFGGEVFGVDARRTNALGVSRDCSPRKADECSQSFATSCWPRTCIGW